MWAISLLNSIGEGVCLVTPDGAILWANDLIQKWGWGVVERAGEVCRANSEWLVKEGTPDFFNTVITEGGREYELTLSKVVVAGPDAIVATPHIAAVLRDVTAARAFRRKIDAIDQAGRELVRLDAESIRQLNSHERLKVLETKIVSYAKELLHFDHFAIRLLDEKTGKLELVMGAGLPEEYDSFEIYPRMEGCGTSGYVAATGVSYVVKDVSEDDLFLPGVTGANSSLTVPLKLQDKIIGIMNVESAQIGAFGEEERQLGEMFARYIAMALHMLDILVVERSTVNKTVAGRVAHEIEEPLRDIMQAVDVLRHKAAGDETELAEIERIRRDVRSAQDRITECAAGPTTLLGVERAMSDTTADPLFKGKRVLVADDEPKIRRIIGDVLRRRGSIVVVCENGGDAVRAFEQPDIEPFDLVLSDIRMPDRNGYEVYAAARKVFPNVPVILMTGFGYDPHHSIVRASQEGLQAVLFKPFQVERLLEEARKAFGSKS